MGEDQLVPIVQMKKIGKKFGSVRVLQSIDFDIYPGEVHILAGENGAGKTTLIKILSGVHTDNEGEIIFEGERIKTSSPIEANDIGISVIYQELSLIPSMSVVDNLFLGRTKTRGGFVQRKVQHEMATQFLENAGVDVDVDEMVENLPISTRQFVEITRAISLDAKVIVMDEPSSALNAEDAEKLFSLVDSLKAQGRGIVYITHRMEEITRLADRITVLRDGKYVGSALAKDLPVPKLINMMVGREINHQIERQTVVFGEDVLKVDNITVNGRDGSRNKLVDNVSLSVRSGEILGIAGLQGSGASELLMGIFGGFGAGAAEKITLNGEEISIKSPLDSISHGIALLTNDRKRTGLVSPMSITENVCLADLKNLTTYGWRNEKNEKQVAQQQGKTLHFRGVPSYESEVKNLSGGNQQKVVIAKWLQIKPKVLLLDEPTRGIDVGAKQEVYALMNKLTEAGMAILLITSEMPELLALSDRIIVMHRGKATAEYSQSDATAEKVLEACMGERSIP